MGLFPNLVGTVEVEERRPRYWNEPRRKRLNFVKSKKPAKTSEWQVATRPQQQHGQAQPRNAQERWDHQQAEAQRRFIMNEDWARAHRHHAEQQRLRAQQIQQMQQMQAHAQQQLGHGGHPHQQGHHGGHGGHQQIPVPPEHHGGRHDPHYAGSDADSWGDEIMYEISGSNSDSSSDSSDDSSHHSKRKHRRQRIMMIEPPKSPKLPKEFYHKSMHGNKKKDEKKKKDKKKEKAAKGRSKSRTRVYEIYESDSSVDSFDLALKRHRSHSRGRRPSRARFVDDSDSDASFVYHRLGRLSSKHRG